MAPEYFDKEVKLYEIYRDYLKHEDSLRNSRTAAFLTIQGLLFAAIGVTFSAGLASFSQTTFVVCFRFIIVAAAIASCLHMWVRDYVMRRAIDGIDKSITNIQRSREGVREDSYWLKYLPKWHYNSREMKFGSIIPILSFHNIFLVAWSLTAISYFAYTFGPLTQPDFSEVAALAWSSMRKWLNIASGVSGLIAAVLWFFSGRILPAPAQGAYPDIVDERTVPFHKKWRRASTLNQWAAFMTGISILLMSIPPFLDH